jgi:hypothetical protein
LREGGCAGTGRAAWARGRHRWLRQIPVAKARAIQLEFREVISPTMFKRDGGQYSFVEGLVTRLRCPAFRSRVGARIVFGIAFVNMLEYRRALRLVNLGRVGAREAGIEHVLDG